MADKYKGKYPKAWSPEERAEFIASRREPEKTSNGVWVNDVTRDDKDLVQWTVAELFALYNNELISKYSAGDEAFQAALLVKAQLKHTDAHKWGSDELYHWLVTGKEPEKTKLGNYVNDPERFTKDVSLLNDSELIDYGLGNFGPFDREREYVLVEALDRFKLNLNTTYEDYALYCSDRIDPPVTPNGTLVNDRTRADRLIKDWSDEELHDWAAGLITSAGHPDADLLSAATISVGGEWFWTKEDVAAFLKDGTKPEVAAVDITRLSIDELSAFISETKSREAFDLFMTKVKRESIGPNDTIEITDEDRYIPSQWDNDDAFTFVAEGVLPATWNGIWVNDVTRDLNKPETLSVVECEGVYRKELHASEAQRDEVLAFVVESLRTHGKKPYDELYADEALTLHYDGTEPATSPEGFYVESILRDSLPFEEWSTEQVRALLKGNIKTVQEFDAVALATANFPESWKGLADYDQLLKWFLDDVVPQVTENGVYVVDPRRDTSSITAWTDAELVALARGWIEGLDNVTEESLIVTLAERKLIKSSEWSLKEVTDYLETGAEPDRTDFGSDEITYDSDTINRKTDLKFFSDWANGLVTVPNPPEHVLNRVRGLMGAMYEQADAQVMSYLKTYKGDGTDEFRELTLMDQLQDGTEASRRKVVELWDMPPETTVEEAIFATKVFKEGDLTTNGVLVVDPRRDLRGAYRWSLEELRSWARGEIPQGASCTPATLAAALRNQISSIDPGWDDASVKAFAATGVQPKRTTNGVLAIDIARDKKYPSDWSDEDLVAWANQEVVTPVAAVDIMLCIRTRFKVPNSYSNDEALRFVLTGEQPPSKDELPFDKAMYATDVQLKGWLCNKVSTTEKDKSKIFDEIRARFKVNVHWTDDDIVTHAQTGQEPAKTSEGLYVNDRLRDIINVNTWTLAEIAAFARGEFKAPTIAMKGVAFNAHARVLIQTEKALPANKWSVDEVLLYLRTGERPTAAAGNVFVNDPVRQAKAALSWSNDELKAFLRGDVEASDNAPEADLWGIVYDRFKIPFAWYHNDARSYVLTGEKVPATPSGIWVRDRERDNRSATTWTRAEVKAWARGQILPGLLASEEDLVEHGAYCFNVPPTLSAAAIKTRIAGITEDTTPMTVAFVREDLLAYAEGMKKEGGNEVKAAQYQQLLLRCIARVTALRGQDFVDGWTEMLKFYVDHKSTIFKPGLLYNGVAMMAVSSKQQKHFSAMTTVLHKTCDPDTRDDQIKTIDFVIALAGLPNEESRHMVLGYYNL